MDTLLTDIAMFGEVLGLPENARRVTADIEGRVRAVKQRLAGTAPVDVFVYDSGEQAAFTLGGNGVGHDAQRRAGARNVFGDVPDVFADVGWEDVAARAPQAIVLVDYLAAPIQNKLEYLTGHPLVAGTPAVRDQRFSTIPLVELTEPVSPATTTARSPRSTDPSAGPDPAISMEIRALISIGVFSSCLCWWWGVDGVGWGVCGLVRGDDHFW